MFLRLLELVKINYPHIYSSVVSYLEGDLNYGHNLYIMRKELFYEMCDFEYSVLFQLDSELDYSSLENPRTIGFCGESLTGMFIHYAINKKGIKSKSLQCVFFWNTEIQA